jgi:hypothetical protein
MALHLFQYKPFSDDKTRYNFFNFFSHNLHKSVVTCQLAPMLRADGRVKYIFLQKRVLMSEIDKYPILINMLASASRNICGRVK